MNRFLERPQHGGLPASVKSENPLLDFSVNLNFAAPPIPDELWLQWKSSVNVYPPDTAGAIEQKLAALLKLKPEQILVTAGGNEALFLALSLTGDRPLVIPTPCFSEYPFLARQLGLNPILRKVPFQDWWNAKAWIDTGKIASSVRLLANPNNPVGFLIPRNRFVRCIQESLRDGTQWIVDEAFIEFTSGGWENSLLQTLEALPNLLVAGSLTKSWSIPGLRLGFLAARDGKKLEPLRQRMITWRLHGLAHCWAAAFLKTGYYKLVESSLKCMMDWRYAFQRRISETRLLKPLPSDSSFFLCENSCPMLSTPELHKALYRNGIHVRRCDTIPGLENENYLRLSTRPPKDLNVFFTALDAIEKTHT